MFLLLYSSFAPFANALPQYIDAGSMAKPAFASDGFTIASAGSGLWDSTTELRGGRGSDNRDVVSVNSDAPRNPVLDFSNLELPTLQRPSIYQGGSYQGSYVELAQQPTAGPVFLCCPDIDTDSPGPVKLDCPAREFAE